MANLITVTRIALIPPFIYAVARGEYGAALIVFAIASLTDYLDGYVARRFNQNTSLGRLLDPAADKLLATTAFATMAIGPEGLPSIPIWLAAAVVIRDLIIVIGSLAIYLRTGFTRFEPLAIGKLNTFLELGLMVFFLAVNITDRLARLRLLLPHLYLVVMASVAASGASYVSVGIRILRQRGRMANP